jgi:TolB-like protein
VNVTPAHPTSYEQADEVARLQSVPQLTQPEPTGEKAVRTQLEKILVSPGFIRSKRLGLFLRFTVEQYLEGRQNSLKEYLVGVEVFKKLESFDPRVDSIVRVEARRLRSKLERYYESEGRNDATIIRFRKGSYVPVIMSQEQLTRERALQPEFTPSIRHKKLIGIGQFTYLGTDPNRQNFCAGLSEDFVTALMKLQGLKVVARKSAMSGAIESEDTGVDYLLEGSFREGANRLRTCVRLIDLKAGVYFWSETFERDLTDSFDIQDEICRSVAAALEGRLTEERVAG